jgi:Domain of unknown function (DUF222)
VDVTTIGRSQHPLMVLVARMRARLEQETSGSLWSLPDEDLAGLLGNLQSLVAQTEALALTAVREADRRDLGSRAGATSTANWLSGTLRTRPETARRIVRLARDLDRELDTTAAALRTGQISTDHATVIARAVADLPAEAGPQVRRKAEDFLLDQARTFHPKDLARLGRTILDVVDPDLADKVLARKLADEEAKANRRRELTLTDDPNRLGSWIRGFLDPTTSDMLRTALDPLARPMPTTADGPDPRTASQRYGDAFAEMLRRYLNSGASPSQGGEKPHLVITIGWDDLTNRTGTGAFLRTGTPMSARTAEEFACDADITWHTGGPDGNPP